MQKCRSRSCLCRTCFNTCCDRKDCKGKTTDCKKYSSFRQLSVFESPPKLQYKRAPRYSWDYYGITKERYRQLTDAIHSGDFNKMVRSAAHTANKDIAEYILLSVMKNKSYEGVEYAEGLGRIPCGRTDFYGYRRYFYSIFDRELRRMGNEEEICSNDTDCISYCAGDGKAILQ